MGPHRAPVPDFVLYFLKGGHPKFTRFGPCGIWIYPTSLSELVAVWLVD